MAVSGWGQVFIQTTAPSEDPVQVGSLWVDTSGTAAPKVCTSVSPFTFSAAWGGGSSGAPSDAQYIVATANGTLTAERVLTDTATVTWDFSVAGQAKATASVFSQPEVLARVSLRG